MKAVMSIFTGLVPLLLASQTVLNNPEEARNLPEIDYDNIVWTDRQTPHYDVPGFDEEFLNSDFFRRTDDAHVEQLLLEKINVYREIMGREKLVMNDTGRLVNRDYAEKLTKVKKITHTLKGTTPTSRMNPRFPYPVGVSENLLRYGSTMKFEDMDAFTDYALHSWINSKGHNAVLLDAGNMGSVGIYTHIDRKKNYQTTVAVFSVIHRQ